MKVGHRRQFDVHKSIWRKLHNQFRRHDEDEVEIFRGVVIMIECTFVSLSFIDSAYEDLGAV